MSKFKVGDEFVLKENCDERFRNKIGKILEIKNGQIIGEVYGMKLADPDLCKEVDFHKFARKATKLDKVLK